MKKIVLFGDSITDMGRWRDADNHGMSFGMGYSLILKEKFIRNNINVELINRGCSADSTTNLLQRLDNDVIALKPDILTILIGTNDVWHLMEGTEDHHGNSIEQFEKNYRQILQTVKQKLLKCKIILFLPFFLPLNQPEREDFWNHMKHIYKYADVVEKIAKEMNLESYRLQPLLNEAEKIYGTQEILADGIHPNVRGAIIIADKFYEVISKILN